MQDIDSLLGGLRAAAEHSRLRILALCARGELSVSELTQILGQSQPRVSRHLKLLVEAGLLQRIPEGAQVFFRLTDNDNAEASRLARALVELMPRADAVLGRDFARLEQVREARAARAQAYFHDAAANWDSIRSLYVPQDRVEDKLLEMVGDEPVYDLLDIGTGTGRVLEILSPRVHRGVGIDLSTSMLTIARSNIERSGFINIHVRQGDMYNLPVDDAGVDLAVIHMVLHYSDDPERVIDEAKRVLRPGGRLLIVDFDSHGEESLRSHHKHRRLGFSDREIERCFEAAGLGQAIAVERLDGDPLTVKFWQARNGEKKATLRPVRSA